MSVDVAEIEAFYGRPEGAFVSMLLHQDLQQMQTIWTDPQHGATYAGQIEKVAVGFPFALLETAALPAVLMPAETGALAWQGPAGITVASIDSAAWPLASEMCDRILVIHALEHVRDQQGFLDEAWRCLRGSGELVLIVPHRRGFLARTEKTPFGQGRPFSRRQIIRQLEQAGFEVAASRPSLCMPAFALGLPNGVRVKLNRLGRFIWPMFGGVLMIRATKKLYSPYQQANPALRHRVRQFIVRQPAGAISPKNRHP